jgi:DNA-directed RNA polymerase sigma subunit (sigma70/sigma32)
LIDKSTQQSVRKTWNNFLRAQNKLKKARREFVDELAAAHAFGATFAELAAIMKVSRQRVGQYLKGVK